MPRGAAEPVSVRFWRFVDVRGPDDCWLWTGSLRSTGYGQIKVDGRPEKSHRVAYRLAHGPITDGALVLHSCDNPPCVNPAHLFLGTHADNMADKAAKGRGGDGTWRPGFDCPHAKLSPAEVEALRRRARAGEPHRALAREFGVATSTVSRVRNCLSYPDPHRPATYPRRMIDPEEQTRRREHARERFAAENVAAADRLRSLLEPLSAAEREYHARFAEASETVTDEDRAGATHWGDIEQLIARRVAPEVRDRRAEILEQADEVARSLDTTVRNGVIAGAWQTGDEVWTSATVQRPAPLRVAQVLNADRPTAFERDPTGDIIAATYDLSTVILTGDGLRIAAEQHVPDWDDERNSAVPDSAELVPFEVWGGSGFERSGNVHPTSRGWVSSIGDRLG